MNVIPRLDAPPLEVVERFAPEVVERLTVVLEALGAARVARDRVRAAREPVAGSDDGRGSATREALAADVAAVAQGKAATAYARVVAGRPKLEGEARALEGYAAQLVEDWNAHGHEGLTRETRARLAKARDQAAEECYQAAEAALVAADDSRSDDGARLRAALVPLAELDQGIERWRLCSTLAAWVSWSRPIHHGGAWDPYFFEGLYPRPEGLDRREVDVVTRARALSDDNLRRLLDERRPAGRPS